VLKVSVLFGVSAVLGIPRELGVSGLLGMPRGLEALFSLVMSPPY
jgi:hypothetical protein